MYDLLVSMPDGIKRVQVKTTTYNGKNGWMIQVGRRPYSIGNNARLVPYDPDSIDLFFIVDGCGSFEVSWLRCKDESVAVFRVVDAFVLAAEVEAPVVLEVAAGDDGAELENGLGSVQAPPRARYVHP